MYGMDGIYLLYNAPSILLEGNFKKHGVNPNISLSSFYDRFSDLQIHTYVNFYTQLTHPQDVAGSLRVNSGIFLTAA